MEPAWTESYREWGGGAAGGADRVTGDPPRVDTR